MFNILFPSIFFSADGDYETVWQEHCQDKETLGEYAEAMKSLATEFWTKRPETRIHWCRSTCQEYFLGGGLEKSLAKDARRKHYSRQQRDSECTTESEESEAKEVSEVEAPTVSSTELAAATASNDFSDSSSNGHPTPSSEPELIFASPEQSLDERRKQVYERYPLPTYIAMWVFSSKVRLLYSSLLSLSAIPLSKAEYGC
jgi:hypothetical protein